MIVTRILGVTAAIVTLAICHQLFKLKGYWQYVYLIALSLLLVVPARFFFYNDAFVFPLVALYFLLKGTEKKSQLLLVISGLISGACFVFKQSGGGLLFPAFIIGILLVSRKKIL
jgi:hypothetical protein